MTDQVIVIECQSCQSRFRLAKELFKNSRAIRVRCRKCGGYIVVENPDLAFPAAAPVPLRPVPRVVPPPPPPEEREPERAEEPPPEPPPEAPEPPQPSPELPPEAPEPLPEPPPEAPTMEDTARAMAELLREIDENAPPPPAKPAGSAPELPPELSGGEADDRKGEYRGPVRVTPWPEPADGSEALASVLEDLFKPGAAASSPAGPAPHAERAGGAEAKARPSPKEPSKDSFRPAASGLSARPPWASPLFLLIVALWLLLLAGAVLLFGTDRFDKWLSGWKAPSGAGVVAGKPPGHPIYEIRNVNWFSDNSYDGGTLFAVTGSVTLRGRSVEEGMRISATIMGRDNAVLSEKTVFAGNFLDNTTLRHTKPEVVDSFLSRGVEEGVSREIQEGETLPFMAVFFDPPEQVYSVAVKPVYTVK